LKEAGGIVKRVLKIISDSLICMFFAFSVLLAFSAFWMLRTWPDLKMDELVYQLSQGFGGAGESIMGSYILSAALPCLAVVSIMFFFFIRLKESRKYQRIILIVTSLMCLVLSVFSVSGSVGAAEYMISRADESGFIKDYYRDPAKVKMEFPQKKRNLIYIFLESMETTYADQKSGGAFKQNVIPELTHLAQENETFSGSSKKLNGAYALPGTTWTMGGMFAASAGLPLQISIKDNDMSKQNSFFPSITTLGDVLEDEGYRNVLLIGSNAGFAGRKNYFESHGGYEMRDYHYANDNGLIEKDYHVWWGYEDNKLIGFAKDTLDELSDSDEPFNLTILTVDTHFENGWVCPDCPDTFGDNQYANVMACSSKKITEFVHWCQKQPWYENTTIVLSGDHLTMDRDFCEDVNEDYNRRVYTAYINSAVENADPAHERIYTTFDHFPSTLAALGVRIEGDRLGLGTNLFSGRKTLSEELTIHDETALLKQKSSFMESLSGISISAKDLYKEGNTLINADIRVKGYNPQSGRLSLAADDILCPGPVHKVRFVVQDSSGTRFYEGRVSQDGSYQADVFVSPQELETCSLRVSAAYEENGRLKGNTVFGYSDGNLLYIGALQKNPAGYIDFLNTLDRERYTVLMSGQGNFTAGLSDEVQQSLYQLGARTDIRKADGLTYLMIRDGKNVIENKGTDFLKWDGTLSNLNAVIMTSGAQSGTASSIMINDGVHGYKEYSSGHDGLNFVVWDNLINRAVSKASFNTAEELANAAVDLKEDLNDPQSIHVSISDIESKEDVVNVYGIVFDELNPEHKQPFELNRTDQGIFSGKFEAGGLNTKRLHIRFYASDLSGQPFILKKIDGSLRGALRSSKTSVFTRNSDDFGVDGEG